MSHKLLGRIALAAMFAFSISVGNTQTLSDEKQELEMAENAIVTTMALQSTSPHLCGEQPSLCISADGIELGTALIAARNTPQSLRSLVGLRRFAFDGGYGESYDQYLCEKGKKLDRYLLEVRAEQLHEKCVTEFNALVKANPKELGSAEVEQVCNSVDNIRRDLRETMEMVKAPPTSCEP